MTVNLSAGRDGLASDLTSCDREAIHIPGAIQPHGILFGLSNTLRVSAVSENTAFFLGGEPRDLLDASMEQLFDGPSFQSVYEAHRVPLGHSIRLPHLHFLASLERSWRAMLHANAAGLILEFELGEPGSELVTIEQIEQFQDSAQRIQSANDIDETCQRLVEEVQLLSGYNRVMLYRFSSDWSGETIAEASDGTLPSYLGLHFPASDIPVQARALYARNPERQIPDIAYKPVPILQTEQTPLDLSQTALRSVSPVHIAYLQNMGVGASMSISIMYQGVLWGLIACHHRSAYYLAPEVRKLKVLLAQLAAARFSLINDARSAQRNNVVKTVEAKLLRDSGEGLDSRDVLLRNGSVLLDLVGATGLAISNGNEVTTLGETPPGPALDDLLAWLSTRTPGVLAIDNLAKHYPAGAALSQAAGILAVPLAGIPENLLVCFRPELPHAVKWAGDPRKPVETVAGVEKLMPRYSFDTWVAEVRGHSRPWSSEDIAAASHIRDTIAEIVVRRSLDIARMNSRLLRSNEELEAFAYIASHDLKEPLRQIESFGSLLQRAFARKTDPPEKMEHWLSNIVTSSRRLQRLINDIVAYARLGAQARMLAPADLGRLLHSVKKDFENRITETGAEINSSPLPVIICDVTEMQRVFQNLIANGLKYRHPDRAPVINITARTTSAAIHPGPADLSLIELSFEDNGIGFDQRHCENIFQPFERLQSADEYEGSGLGLTICRKLIDRHGGTISARGQPGIGATFIISLPQCAFAELKEANHV